VDSVETHGKSILTLNCMILSMPAKLFFCDRTQHLGYIHYQQQQPWYRRRFTGSIVL
jgi:hypothetical protein